MTCIPYAYCNTSPISTHSSPPLLSTPISETDIPTSTINPPGFITYNSFNPNHKKYHVNIPQPDGTYQHPCFICFHLDHTGGHHHLVVCCQGDSIDYGSDLIAAPFMSPSPSPADDQDLVIFIHTHPEADAVELGLHALNDIGIKAVKTWWGLGGST